jgi:hypothetical protein
MNTIEKAYKLAALAVRQRLAEQRPADLEALECVVQGDVGVYKGSYDQAEEVFGCLGVPVVLDPDAGALKTKIVVANCSSHYTEAFARSIAGFVEEGGWLISSDWGLDYVLERAFPGMVRWTRQGTNTEVISVEPNLDSLWSEIVVLGADPQWWLWGSHPIEVLDRERVRVEAASHDLLTRYGAPVVAARFDWGAGHVFHVISHFWAKTTATPTVRHQGPCTDFLRAGMRLSEDGIRKVLREAKVEPDAVNFAMLQSAATSTELIAQLCVQAVTRN